MEALEEVSKPGTKANRLMRSKEDFSNGLRLLDAYGQWYDETIAELADVLTRIGELFYATDRFAMDELDRTKLRSEGA